MFHVNIPGFLLGTFRPLGRCSYELLEQPLEIFLILEFNLNLVLSVRRLHLYGRMQHIFQSFCHRFKRLRQRLLLRRGVIALTREQTRDSLCFSNRKFFRNKLVRQLLTPLLSWEWTGLRVHDPPISSPRTIIAAPLREARANATH